MIFEEFVEGTMINLFYDFEKDEWIIATKTSVGANNRFFISDYSNDMTFKEMFYDIVNYIDFNIETLSKMYSYSFIIQHNNNRIVSHFDEKKLYLIAIYEIDNDNNKIYELSNVDDMKKIVNHTKINFPKRYKFNNYSDIDNYINNDLEYNIVGVILKYNNLRSKVRNPKYEYVRRLRGNQPKLQYHYLTLRINNLINEYLKYYPESILKFNEYDEQIKIYTNNLYKNYISCYIHKTLPLGKFPYRYKNHMFKLHEIYINNLVNKKQYITKNIVNEYINNLHPAQLMYSLNYQDK